MAHGPLPGPQRKGRGREQSCLWFFPLGRRQRGWRELRRPGVTNEIPRLLQCRWRYSDGLSPIQRLKARENVKPSVKPRSWAMTSSLSCVVSSRKPWSPSPGKWVSPAPSNGGSAAAPEPIRTIMEWMIFWTSPSAPGVPPLQPAMESAASRSLSNATPLLRHPSAGACCRPRPRHMAAPKCHTAQPRTGQRHGGTTDPCRARSAGSHPILPPRKGGGLTADDAGFAGSLR